MAKKPHVMRLPHLRFLLLAAATAWLSACGPADNSGGDPFAQHDKDLRKSEDGNSLLGEIRPPPEIARTFGITAKDDRSEILLLQGNAKLAYPLYQKAILSVLSGRQNGMKLTSLDAADDAEKQVAQFRAALDSKPIAILLDPADGADFSSVLPAATQAGIFVIGLQKGLKGCSSLVYCDPAAIGSTAAEIALDALKRKAAEEQKSEVAGRIVQIRGAEKSPLSQQISIGLEEGLRKQPGVILVHDAPAGWTPETVFHRFSEAGNIQKQFDVVFAHSDVLAQAVAKAATHYNTREQLLIIGVDGLDSRNEGLDLLRNGEIDATVARPLLVDLALSLALKKKADPAFQPKESYVVPPIAVTPKNHSAFSARREFALPSL